MSDYLRSLLKIKTSLEVLLFDMPYFQLGTVM